MKLFEPFETDRLLIRPMSIEDAAFLLELVNTPKWLKYIGNRNVKTISQAENYIETKMLPQLTTLGYSNNMVIRKSDHIKIGSCGLFNREGIDGVDIGFAFLPAYEKQGYAFESTHSLLQQAVEQYKLKKISAITTLDNKSSQHLLEKLGLHFEKMVKIPNDEVELMLYQL